MHVVADITHSNCGEDANQGTSTAVLKSDLQLDVLKISPSSMSNKTRDFNSKLQQLEAKCPKWYHIGAAEYRWLRKAGCTPLPGAALVPSASTISVPSRDADRSIQCRVLRPKDTSTQPRGIFLHIHGGGWVLNDEESSDSYLETIANTCQLICCSVGYRLAPEHPYPAGPDDCLDVAQWLINHGPERYGTELAFVGGESAGANLAMLTALSLLQSPVESYANFRLKGLLLHYGVYALNWQPGTMHFQKDPVLILDKESLTKFRGAYLPDGTAEDFVSPSISPFYADLKALPLPPMLTTCGTEDCLLEDSAFMTTRWVLAGGEACLKLFPGSPHGFIMFDPEMHENAGSALRDVATFVDSRY
ncbi:uncharacterized protein E0L32_007749 [Thyridium curvatum]|uniref:Alpha/beta hydrolase fold-3 domain-containing protein n=1 Tax=Thyridium curvatum TaxID=1093900 RepID=A0A507B3R4_9PEZI|nr:uncharacterized protein E0L32_007749 [Thyridium curvatum]TPX11538.1 hypothetical protein E0L32_007749 [Thyridium curvatum]